jgi:hypothetical protein
MYLSSFNVNTSSSKAVNLKTLKIVIMNDNTEFIYVKKGLGFEYGN